MGHLTAPTLHNLPNQKHKKPNTKNSKVIEHYISIYAYTYILLKNILSTPKSQYLTDCLVKLFCFPPVKLVINMKSPLLKLHETGISQYPQML